MSGYVRIPAPPYEVCPKCHACNPDDRCVSVWRVADAHGSHRECDCCGHDWDYRPPVDGPPIV